LKTVKNTRKDKRFSDIGKVNCSALCIFSGVLLDVSLTGCCVRFPAVLSPDQDQDYELSISLFNKTAVQPFLFISHVQWIRSSNDTTEIGFRFMHSRGTKALGEYLAQVSAKEESELEGHNSFKEE